MKKLIKDILGWTITPGLLAAHFLTQHAAFLFLLGAVSTVSLAVSAVASFMWVIWVISPNTNAEVDAAMWEMVDELTRFSRGWKRVFTWVVTIAVMGYLLWVEAFVTATLYLVAALAAQLLCFLFSRSREVMDNVEDRLDS